MTTVLILEGTGLFDVTCTLNTDGLPGITYNVTRITRDAIAGRFGQPQAGFIDQLGSLGPEEEWRNVDRAKVYAMIYQHTNGVKVPNHFRPGTQCSILDVPLLAVDLQLNEATKARVPVDGNHRLKARMLLKMQTLVRYVVPVEMEREYRVTHREVTI